MKIKLLYLLLFCGTGMFAQEKLSLETLGAFKEQAGNWQLVGDVAMDRNIDIHQKPEAAEGNKRKRKKKKESATILAPMTFKEGTGILLNNFQEGKKDNLYTNWEHGDIYLEMEVMLPKGSNSGIYLQGMYELQLCDSWGVTNPKFSDIGGIYRNWESEPGKIFHGIAPLSNAAKAPGLWQELRIHFQAPRFAADGSKTSNAKFVSVFLNGQLIHSNVEVPLPTGGAISNREVAKGPLMIQGDHGAVAFRNIRYRSMTDSDVKVSSVSYKTYKGDFKGLEDLEGAKTASEGTVELIDINVVGEEDSYGAIFSGNLEIPVEDTYLFHIGYTGGAEFLLDGKSVAINNSSDAAGTLTAEAELTPGKHSFEIKNVKNAGWRAPRLGLAISTATTNPLEANAFNSFPPNINSVSPIYVEPGARPRLLRGFVSFKGSGKRLSHTIAVGTPKGINYVYDLGSANIIGLWRGNFVDATPMWHDRGNGSFNPRGAVQWTFLNQPIAQLENLTTSFPTTGERPDFISKGYRLDAKTGLPIFKHLYKGVEIENGIRPDSTNTYLINEINFSKAELTDHYCKLAEGKIEKLADGSYAIDDRQYYINLLSEQLPTIREVQGTSELLVPVNGSSIKYEIIW
tara:strand:- start:50380 stop:52263 length:1884 start_codon:yes stop_codon:yes gene_type:complete